MQTTDLCKDRVVGCDNFLEYHDRTAKSKALSQYSQTQIKHNFQTKKQTILSYILGTRVRPS